MPITAIGNSGTFGSSTQITSFRWIFSFLRRARPKFRDLFTISSYEYERPVTLHSYKKYHILSFKYFHNIEAGINDVSLCVKLWHEVIIVIAVTLLQICKFYDTVLLCGLATAVNVNKNCLLSQLNLCYTSVTQLQFHISN